MEQHATVKPGRQAASVPIGSCSTDIERWMRDQSQLAALATADDVRAMHKELEQFYRTQLVAMHLADRLNERGQAG